MIRSALVSLLALSCSADAQVKTFQLGALRENVFKEFGTPEKFFAPQPNRYLHGLTEYRAAAGVWARIDDVFMRETATNAYEIHVMYHTDSRQSRLHPKERVGRVEFTVDKPKSAKETLADLAEAKSICAGGCSLYGIAKYGSYEILAYPSSPPAEMLELGRQVATGFKESDTQRTWAMGFHLTLEERPTSLLNPQPANWEGKVTDIEFSAVCLQCDLALYTSSSPRPIELGTWQPEK